MGRKDRRVGAVFAVGAVIMMLAGCATGFIEDDGTSENNVEEALEASDLPLSDVEVISVMDGFERLMTVRARLDEDEISYDDYLTLMSLTARNTDSRTHARISFLLQRPECLTTPIRPQNCGGMIQAEVAPIDEVNERWSDLRGEDAPPVLGASGNATLSRLNDFLDEVGR